MKYSYKEVFKVLGTRNKTIGFRYERKNEQRFSPWIIKTTPSDPYEWKKNIAKGVDFILKENIEVECKYVNHWVYASAIRNCYLPRFSKDAKEKIVLTNNKRRFTKKARELLRANGIKLMTPSELEEYLKERDHTVFLLKIIISCLSTCIKESNILSKFIVSSRKIVRKKVTKVLCDEDPPWYTLLLARTSIINLVRTLEPLKNFSMWKYI